MDSKATLYAEKSALIEVLGKALDNESLLDNIVEIFKNHCNICIDLTDSEVDAIFASVDYDNLDLLFTIFSALGIKTPIALKSFFEQMDAQEDVVVSKPNSFFLRSCSFLDAESLRNKYGVWVISKDEVTNRMFEALSFKDEFEPDTQYGTDINGWRNIVRENNLKIPPSNSLIISDNFLLSNKMWDRVLGADRVLGLTNLTHLLDVILPQHLDIPYYILILCPVKDFEETQMLQKVAEWEAELITSLNRTYPIQIEVVFSPKVIHKRIIYMNYCFWGTEKGFKIFKPFSNRVYRDGDQRNSAWSYTYFHDPFRAGRREHQLANDDILKVREIYIKARENYNNGVTIVGQPKFVGSPLGASFSPNRIFD